MIKNNLFMLVVRICFGHEITLEIHVSHDEILRVERSAICNELRFGWLVII